MSFFTLLLRPGVPSCRFSWLPLESTVGGGGVGFSQWPAAGAYGATLRGLDKGLCQLKANRRRHPFPGWPGACSGLCCFRAPLGKG